ncbi:hypothetical protein JKA73_17475 [Myxococcus xanthus]|uniref:hypothetical protein n=1 Tax=Myxococcus xanthus TaxID=34 RepID=UPI0019178ABD|nr:hypothetical protein [Myxococcus xanthus]QQR47727.1 hypothetical protein JKA73_17475 [Myxococcus xanthus]
MPSCSQPAQCSEADCRNAAAPRHKRCWAHLKRVTRKQSMSAPLAPTYESPWERLTAAALAYADASDDDEDFARARDRLRKAAVAYAHSLEEQPPPPPPPAPRARKAHPEAQLKLWSGMPDTRNP